MANRKALRIEKAPGTACVRFAWNGGGEVPHALQGLYTTHLAAKSAFQAWNAEQEEAVVLATPEGTPSTKFIA